MSPPPVELLAVGSGYSTPSLLPPLQRGLQELLGLQVVIVAPFDPPTGSAGANHRVASNVIVDALVQRSGPTADPTQRWVLGVTDYDLSAPGRSYVFGEATLGGGWAIVSTARLLTPDLSDALLLERLCKESIHELGHLAGLDHCPRNHCVMNLSPTSADVDRKESNFCEACRPRFFAAPKP